MDNSATLLNLVLKNVMDGFVLIDKTFRVLCVNHSLEQYLQTYFNKKIKVGDDYRDFVVPAAREIFLDTFAQVLEGETVEVELQTANANASVWFEYRLSPAYGDDNQIIGVIMVARNVDEKKKAELSLRRSENTLRRIIQDATCAILITDANGTIQETNAEFRKITGYDVSDLAGKKSTVVFPALQQIPAFEQEHERRHDPENDPKNEFELPVKSGKIIHVQGQLRKFNDEEGEFLLYMFQDLTDRIRREKQLKRINDELLLRSNVNRLLFSSTSISQLFTELCEVLIDTGKYQLAWIGQVSADPADGQLVLPVASAGAVEYLKNLRISLLDTKLSKGPTATALRFGKIVVTNNVSTSDDFKPWLENARKFGIQSSIVVPLQESGKVRAALNIYSGKIDAFAQDEKQLIEDLSRKVGIAVMSFHVREENEKIRNDLRDRVKELTAFYLLNSHLQQAEDLNKEVLQKIPDILVSGWRYPEKCSCRIVFEGQEYTSKNFRRSSISQNAIIRTIDGASGHIELFYTDDEASGGMSFMPEEYELLDNVARIVTIHLNKLLATQELRISEANTLAQLNNTDVGHLLLDRNLKVVTFNARYAESYQLLTGIRIEKDMNFLSVLKEPKKVVFTDALEKVNATMNTYSYESVFEVSGQDFFLQVSLAPVLSRRTLVGYSLSAFDITDLKRREKERQNIITQLTQRNRDLEQFAYIISHNIRSPLANILGLVNIVNGEVSEKDRVFALKGLSDSAKRLDGVLTDLNQILSFRNTEKNWTDVDLQELTTEILQTDFSNAEVTVNTGFSDVPVMHVVRPYLRSIFTNMISNSIKYARPGVKPRVDIYTEYRGGNVALVFSDNGSGIDLEKHGAQVFGLYKRFRPDIEGKGLGLFMVKNQVEAMNGEISVQSKVNEGTMFTLLFRPLN